MIRPKTPPTVETVQSWLLIMLTMTLLLISLAIHQMLTIEESHILFSIIENFEFITPPVWFFSIALIPLPSLLKLVFLFKKYNFKEYGLRIGLKDYFLIKKLKIELLNSKRFSKSYLFNREVAKLPKITINRSNNHVTIKIRNSLALNEPLDSWDISSALGDYIVEKQYLTKNRNYYVYDLLDTKTYRRLVFDDYESYKQWCK